MIGFLEGGLRKPRVEQTKSGIYQAIIKTLSGVGYTVYVDQKVRDRWEEKFENQARISINLFIYTDVRENAIDLYGFEDTGSLTIFKKLISVKGVGPKTALLITGRFTPVEIELALGTRSIKFFEAVAGIGKKTAAAVIDKLGKK